jgi:hypothetical protein
VKAELHADAGASAASDDFFRCAPFLAAEATTHTLQVGPARLPVIVREVPGSDRRDAISPYGYPGATLPPGADPVDPSAVDWTPTGLVSLFVRDRIGPPSLAGGTERSLVQVHDPGGDRAIRTRLAEQVRANERSGWTVETAAGPGSDPAARSAFHALYTQTMERTGAAGRYFFDPPYFDEVLRFERSWLLLARSDSGEVGAGAIAAVSDNVVHYYLGGTAEPAREASPFKNVVAAMLDLADGLELPLNLGGGLAPGDGLERFKRGFANAELPFVTHEIVCDRAAYDRLAAGRAADGFFPAYRAPSSGA